MQLTISRQALSASIWWKENKSLQGDITELRKLRNNILKARYNITVEGWLHIYKSYRYTVKTLNGHAVQTWHILINAQTVEDYAGWAISLHLYKIMTMIHGFAVRARANLSTKPNPSLNKEKLLRTRHDHIKLQNQRSRSFAENVIHDIEFQ